MGSKYDNMTNTELNDEVAKTLYDDPSAFTHPNWTQDIWSAIELFVKNAKHLKCNYDFECSIVYIDDHGSYFDKGVWRCGIPEHYDFVYDEWLARAICKFHLLVYEWWYMEDGE